MKTLKVTIYTFLIFLLILPINLMAQKKEIPITTSSKEALKLFQDGRDKLENAEITAAAALFDKAIKLDPNFAMAYLYRSQSGGGYNIFQENLNKAVSLMDKVSEGERLEILYYQVSSKGDGQKTKEYLVELLKLFPSDKRVHANAGIYYYSINDFPTALFHFKKCTELDNRFAPAFNMLGYCYSSQNNYKEAEKAFQTYIKLIPKRANGYDSYAELLLKMGKYDESMVQYKKAMDIDPNFVSAMIGTGNNLIFKGNFDSARKYYELAYDHASNINGKFSALYWKAVSFIHEGNSEKSIEILDQYRALAETESLMPNVINSYQQQALIYTETGNPPEGLKCIEKARSLIEKSQLPDFTKENLTLYTVGLNVYALTANGEMDKAQVEYDKCKQMIDNRKNPAEEMGLNGILAYHETMKGDYYKAIDLFSKADKEDPFNWYYNAVAYSKKGDDLAATKLYDKITTWNVNSMGLALVRKKAIGDLSNK